MEQMTLSEVCKKYHFTRRVIQGYEKEGLIKHTSKNKFGYLIYDEEQIKKIAYIRYLQLNKLTLKEISTCANFGPGAFISAAILRQSNIKHEKNIEKRNRLIKKNNLIMEICEKENDVDVRERKIFDLIMEELTNEETIQDNN